MNAYVNSIVTLPIEFPCGYSCTPEFYVTKLEGTYPVVLSYSWLSQCNPTIDWTEDIILYQKPTFIQLLLLFLPVQDNITPDHTKSLSPLIKETTPPIKPSPPEPVAPPKTPQIEGLRTTKPSISFVSTTAFQRACRVKGAVTFQLLPRSQMLTGQIADIYPENPDLSNIPKEYWQFADIFCKQKAKFLPVHCPYNLTIQIEEGAILPFGPIYSLSSIELQTLQEFIEKNTKMGIIQPSNSPYGVPALFVKKKNSTLCLYVNYQGLNHLTRKDRYPIPLITDLLDAPKKACYYTKIDLRSTYHLVYIARGNEWKTAFRTCYRSFEWLVMPFGLSNTPSVFQRFMNDIFSDL